MKFTKHPLSIEDLLVCDGPIWIERLDHPFTDIQGWARIYPRFNSEHSVGLRYPNMITAFGKSGYGTEWIAYTVTFDPARGTPVLYYGKVISLEELSESCDVYSREIRALQAIIFSRQ